MEIDLVVERMKLMVEMGDFAALNRLCESPMLKTITKITLMAPWGTTEGIRQLLAAVPSREPEEIRIDETECDVDLATLLGQAGVHTIGDLEKLSDEELLRIARVGYDRVLLLRALTTKYMAASKGKRYRLNALPGEKTKAEQTRDLHTRIADLLREGKNYEQVVEAVGCKRSLVLLVAKRLRQRDE